MHTDQGRSESLERLFLTYLPRARFTAPLKGVCCTIHCHSPAATPVVILANSGPITWARQTQYRLNLIDSLLRNEPSSLDRGEASRMTSQIPKVYT